MKIKTKLSKYLVSIIILLGIIVGGFYLFKYLNPGPVSGQTLAKEYNQSPEIKKVYKVEKATLKMEPKDQNSVGVVLGEAGAKEFVPDLEINKWDSEVKFKIKPDISNIPDSQKKVTMDGDKINYETPQVTYQYNNKPDLSADGGYEYSEILKTKPDSNVFTTPIETENLDFFYQPALDQEQQKPNVASCTETQCVDKKGKVVRERPENVVGSYAVYYKDGKSGDYSALGGKNYKTGKAFHIYRPEVIDAKGNRVWADLKIDTTNGKMIITVPEEYLDKAVYPVNVDPNLGYDTIGSSDDGGWDNANTTYSYGLTGASGGTLTTIKGAFFNSTTEHVKMAVYENTGGGTPPASNATVGTLIAGSTSPVTNVSQATKPTLDSEFTSASISGSVSANTYYWMAFVVDDTNTKIACDSGLPDYSLRWDGTAYASFPAADGSGATNHTGQRDSIYAVYTTGGGASAPTVTTQAVSGLGTIGTQTYSTSFPATENPISESSRWINGLATGLDWANVATQPGLAYGIEVQNGGPNYHDATAILTGTWSRAQAAQATVYVGSPTTADYPEVELRLESSLSAHSCTGYEVFWAVGNNYLSIARWNGPEGDFTYLPMTCFQGGSSGGNECTNGTTYNAVNGDVIMATIDTEGNIKAYKNGVLFGSTSDTTFTSGAPGIGFDYNSTTGGEQFGFTNFSTYDNAAVGNGNVTSDGGATITERGICWNTTGTPTTSDSKSTVPGTTGSYSGLMTGLSAGTTYHVRAYATNSQGTSYGDEVTFSSLGPLANVYYSVGQNTGDLKNGSPTLTVDSSGNANLGVGQTGNIGVGDYIEYGTSPYQYAYISAKSNDNQHWKVVTATGGSVGVGTTMQINAIKHTFSTLEGAIAGASNTSHLGIGTTAANSDLTSLNVILNIPCYYDSGPDTSAVTVSGYTTSSTNYIKIYTPSNTLTEVNTSQRHSGKWSDTKYSLQTGTGAATLQSTQNYTVIDGLQVYNSGTASGDHDISLNPYRNHETVKNSIIKGGYTGIDVGYQSSPDGDHKIYNNIIYNTYRNGINSNSSSGHGNLIYNNTVYNCGTGHIDYSAGIAITSATNDIFTNNISVNNYHAGGNDYDFAITGQTQSYNISSDATASGAGSLTNKTLADMKFFSTNSGAEDLHLGIGSVAAGVGTNLSATFSTDIDGDFRGAIWSIGADDGPEATVGAQNFAPVQNATAGLDYGLVGYWSFNGQDIVAGTAFDRSGQNNNGTISGATATEGKLGQALGFDGSSNTVSLGNPANLNFGSSASYSLCWWEKPKSVDVTEAISKTGGGNERIHFYHSSGYLYRWSDFAGPAISTSEGWVDICYTYSANGSNNGTETFYKNGSFSTSRTGAMPSWNSSDVWNIGSGVGSQWLFSGSIDEVRIYNRALSSTEVGNLYRLGGMTMNSTQLSQNSNKSGLVGHWTFDGSDITGVGVGATAVDSSGSGNNGILSGTAPTPTEGKLGQALNFNGSSSYLNTSSGVNVNPNTGDITISAWLNVKDFAQSSGVSGRVITQNIDGNNGFIVAAEGDPAQTFTFVIWKNGTEYARHVTTTTWSTGTWYHVVCVWITATNSPAIYINGASQDLTSTAGYGLGSVDNKLFIGKRNDDKGYYNGSIDDVRVYNRALSSAEVGDLYRLGQVAMGYGVVSNSASVCPSQAGYIAWDNFEATPSGGSCSGASGYSVYSLNNSTNPLEGNYDAYASTGGSNVSWYFAETTSAPLYVAAKLKISNIDSSGGGISIAPADYSHYVKAQINSDSTLSIVADGSTCSTSTGTVPIGSAFYLKLAYASTTSATVYTSTDGSSWTSQTTCSSAMPVSTIGFTGIYSGDDFQTQMDNVKIKTSDVNYP